MLIGPPGSGKMMRVRCLPRHWSPLPGQPMPLRTPLASTRAGDGCL
ncbi:MAG: hypothetical protein LAP85_04070 [Acidobacteriia bacterium]|nr:hypothetical protein [Terriglobia bacterium]